ncbi:hypothetical protein [Psychroserpens sp.]
MKNYFTILFSLAVCLSFSQTTYNGNGNTGFGGVIGPGSMTINNDGTTLTFEVTRGPGEFFDALVFYIDSTTGGRLTIDGDVNDQNDPLRRAISSAGDNASVLTFPAGFEVDYALAIDSNFGGLWAIPPFGTVGNGELQYVASLESTLTMSSDASFTFEVDWAELALAPTGDFKFIGIYLNSNNGFTSDEAFGSDIAGGNIGGSNFTFTSYFEYANTLSIEDFESKANAKIVNNTLIINNYIGDLNVNIFDVLGRNINTIKTRSESNSFNTPLNLSDNQLYFIRIEGVSFTKTIKMILR